MGPWILFVVEVAVALSIIAIVLAFVTARGSELEHDDPAPEEEPGETQRA